MNPEMLARSGSEHGEQCALFCWASLPEQQARWPELRWMHAIPNAGARGNKIAASQLKAEGVKSGVADVLLPIKRGPFGGMYIEMKRANGVPSDVTKEQREFMVFVETQGYVWSACFGWKHAAHEIERYMLQMRVKAYT